MKKLFSMFFMATMVLSMFLGTICYAEAEDSLNDQIAIIEEYLVKDENFVSFNLEKAIADGIDKEIIEIGECINELSDAYNASNHNDKQLLRSIEVAVYGNYCGPNTPWNKKDAPIDTLDTYCMYHDLCYLSKGWGNKECNRKFVQQLKAAISRGAIPKGKAMVVAKGAIAIFSKLS